MPTPGIPEFYQKRQWLTITELLGFSRCPRKFFYSAGCGLKPRAEMIPLTYGIAIHAAYPWAALGEPELAFSKFLNIWEPSGLEDLQDKKRNKSCAQDLLHSLSSQFKTRPLFEIIKPPKTLNVRTNSSEFEIPFCIDIGLPIPLAGSIDGLVRMCSTNKLYPLEIKTTSQLGNTFFFSFERNCQVVGYTIAARNALGISDIDGAIVHGILVTNVNQNSLALPFPVSKLKEEQFLLWAREKGTEMLAREASGNWSTHLSGCNQIGMFGLPGYTCPYRDLCEIPDWTAAYSLFTVDRHEPFTAID